ncbi:MULTISPECIES: GNAT family N-acetyltransferase [Bradyrhizobium]|uniref:GNAT family N-acetyltransferase n=1 Tax=Bradyrhizobium TaxID=374 RepID=UPI001CE3A19B|nr:MULTISPECIES: GNAT family N-acetyltransferase [Bradyrhizobium]MCA6104581.1 GNAT family N-acetyltransferase [Bradyrhizobium australafricanum]MCP3415666.1 GNAT family N-acetyltransferase [Bradyrhizobium brasilense]
MTDDIQVRRIGADEVDKRLERLADILIDCVANGDSVSFLPPLTRRRALVYWRSVADAVVCNGCALLAAEDGAGQIVGTIQMVPAASENQLHSARVVKVLVERSARRRGIGRRLLSAVSELARKEGKTLLTLSTTTGSAAERLYASEGWQRVGIIPGCVLAPDGTYRSATFFYKHL